MKRAAVALRSLLTAAASGLGLEGAFLVAGTVLLATGAAYIHPAGPWLVTGGIAALLGLALAVTPRRAG